MTRVPSQPSLQSQYVAYTVCGAEYQLQLEWRLKSALHLLAFVSHLCFQDSESFQTKNHILFHL